MHFTYCPQCGKRLIPREIGDEGMLPYCEDCRRPFWDMFATSVICAAVNEYNEVALLRQDYVSTQNHVCVAGIIQMGETAEAAAVREIKEEIGQDVLHLTYVRSYYYEKSGMLMLGFMAEVKKTDFALSGEVDAAEWVPLSEAPELLRKGGVAWQLVSEIAGKFEKTY